MSASVKRQFRLLLNGLRCRLHIFLVILLLVSSLVWIGRRSSTGSAQRTLSSSAVGKSLDSSTNNGSTGLSLPPKRRLFVRLPLSARLGNRMFAHASTLGLAAQFGLDATLSEADDRHFLTSVFNVSTPVVPDVRQSHLWTVQWPWRTAVYVKPPSDMTAGAAADDDIQVIGYLQSWRYFRQIESRVRAEFRFNDFIARRAAHVLDQLTAINFPPTANRAGTIVRVGVHVRRNDMALVDERKRGYRVADGGYIRRAIDYVVDRVKSNDANASLLFVVCTDDEPWALRHVRSTSHPVAFASSPYRRAAVDLAVLAACDHVITTVGTFSWWAGYLRPPGGLTVYYAGYPRPGTEIGSDFRSSDFFPPEWIALL